MFQNQTAALDGFHSNGRLQRVAIKTMRVMNKNTSSSQLCGQKMSATKPVYNGTLFSYICCYSWLILFFALGLKCSWKPRAKDLHLRIFRATVPVWIFFWWSWGPMFNNIILIISVLFRYNDKISEASCILSQLRQVSTFLLYQWLTLQQFRT